MITKIFQDSFRIITLGLCSISFFGCTLKQSDDVKNEDQILIKEGRPLPTSLHGTWTLDNTASAAVIQSGGKEADTTQHLLDELESATGSSMKIDAETWTSITPKGHQVFEAAVLSPPESSEMTIGLEAYKTLIRLLIIEQDSATLRVGSETNPVMQMFVWRKEG